MVVNYDNFYLAPDLADAYVIPGSPATSPSPGTATSSFMRLTLSEQLSNRGPAPHIYESRQLAMHWNGK